MDNKISYYRNKHNLTLKELSIKSGISVSQINYIENNISKDVKLSTAISLSRALGVDIYELFCIKKY